MERSIIDDTLVYGPIYKTSTSKPNQPNAHTAGAFFTTYEAVKSHFTTTAQTPECNRYPITNALPTPVAHALASSTAEMVACLMTTPAEVLKQNAQVVDSTAAGTNLRRRAERRRGQSAATRAVLGRFRAWPWKLWSGYFALVGRNLPFTGLQFPVFELVRGRVVLWWEGRKAASDGGGTRGWNVVVERAGLTGLAASVSGTIAAVVTTPVDVIKTRVMLSASEGGGGGGGRDGEKGKRPGTLAMGRKIFREEGVKGLFRGGAIRAGWTAVSLALYLSIYEGSRFYLENRRKERDGLRE